MVGIRHEPRLSVAGGTNQDADAVLQAVKTGRRGRICRGGRGRDLHLPLGTEGWVKRSEGYKSDEWSSVTYEAADSGQTVDILILSNEKDG